MSAEMFPIIDVRHGYLIGAVENQKWIGPADATKSVKPGAKVQVYGVTGPIGNAAIVKLDTQSEPCPDQPVVKLNPRKMKQGEIAFAAVSQTASPASLSRVAARSTSRRVISPEIAKWNPLPRKPKSLDVKDEKADKLVREFLRERGLKDPVVQITQAVQIDLDGDGQDEVVISATHYKNGDEIPDEPTPNTYSFVMTARSVNGKMEPTLVAGELYPEGKGDAPPNKFEISALLDLNGDGKIDIVIRSAYYEGDEISVYKSAKAGFNKAVSVGCGL
jgi:hypothetical protein